MEKNHRELALKAAFAGIAIIMILLVLILLKGNAEAPASEQAVEMSPTPTPTRIVNALSSATPTPTFEESIEVVFIDDLPVAVFKDTTPTPTSTPTPTPVPPTCTQKPTQRVSTPTPTNTPKPQKTAAVVPYPTGYPHSRKVDDPDAHTWKPYARYTVYLGKNTAQCRLQNKAHTAENGLRVVTDPNGIERYCVSLAPQWAGGQPVDIGRCVDIKMANGNTLHCVLGDVKKHEHTQGKQGYYGSKGELIEFIADQDALPKNLHGDISDLGGAFAGAVKSVTVLDLYIDGFGR